MITKYLNDFITGKDNSTGDVIRFMMFGGFIAVILLAFIEVIKGHEISLMDVASAIGSLAALGGLGLKLKETTEPNKNNA